MPRTIPLSCKENTVTCSGYDSFNKSRIILRPRTKETDGGKGGGDGMDDIGPTIEEVSMGNADTIDGELEVRVRVREGEGGDGGATWQVEGGEGGDVVAEEVLGSSG
ncbi:uncharacterized protein A4U43_UnF11780 [Asparagus officinalis]|uniref:Uncharacterized protein n=1 Tax=Asparagus officinalis TaxID=4686 RepID=A0A1R3L565_ASPOF|nr:uncharacterized protein A4U43_UnF11780 [Asparagus officinalis]